MAIVLDGVGTVNGVLLPTTGFGKVLQVVRATDATARSTTSTSFVDASLSVTITPQKSNSAILILSFVFGVTQSATNDNMIGAWQITDSSNNAISGAQSMVIGSEAITGTGTRTFYGSVTLAGYSTPATISAVTYKLRFKSFTSTTTASMDNPTNTGQLYAIEVSA